MSSPAKPKPQIPSWQRQSASCESAEAQEQGASEREREGDSIITPSVPVAVGAEDSVGTEDSIGNAHKDGEDAILDQGRRFLQESSVKSMSRDRKVEFQKLKGMSDDKIEKLIRSSTDPSPPESRSQAADTAGTLRQQSRTRSAPDVPPIITYPEFLVHSQNPPPLITARRLLYTAYFTGGIVAAFYGLSKYIIGPMTESLTEARHDLASHTQTLIQELNERISKIISAAPPANKVLHQQYADTSSDTSDTESDPTELYHRDFGTQTSPYVSRRPSTTETTDTTRPSGRETLVEGHQNRLQIMRSHLSELLDKGKREETSIEDSKNIVKDLGHYLDTLTYPALSYSNYNYEGMYGMDNGQKSVKDDAIDAVKKEIRGVKGVLLNARNFPSSVRAIR
ncbi:MAG: hypothetical protein Q9157_000016 [Trypethelium eluteriae]